MSEDVGSNAQAYLVTRPPNHMSQIGSKYLKGSAGASSQVRFSKPQLLAVENGLRAICVYLA